MQCKEGLHQVILYNLLMGGVQNKQIYKSESKLVVAYGCGVEWECGRVTHEYKVSLGHDED